MRHYLVNISLAALMILFIMFVAIVAFGWVAPDCAAITVHDANGVAYTENGCPGSGD